MKRQLILFLSMLAWSTYATAQFAITYDDEAEWQAYEDFNTAFLD